MDHLQKIIDALSSGSLEIELYHQGTRSGHSEVAVMLKGDYLGTAHRVHLTSEQDWSTFGR